MILFSAFNAMVRKFKGWNLNFRGDGMQEGVVKWFSDQKGYGFIKANHKEYFVHYKDIQADGFKSLQEGQVVKFVPVEDAKGRPNAVNVWPRVEVPE